MDLFVIIIVVVIIAIIVIKSKKQSTMNSEEMIQALIKGTFMLTPGEFSTLWQNIKLGKTDISGNVTGIYILHNITKDLHYIGQATKVLQRVNNHFTGRGNGDVYADYKYGDEWTIRVVRLIDSHFDNLDDLEKHAIGLYDAFNNGYNKTRGNGAIR